MNHLYNMNHSPIIDVNIYNLFIYHNGRHPSYQEYKHYEYFYYNNFRNYNYITPSTNTNTPSTNTPVPSTNTNTPSTNTPAPRISHCLQGMSCRNVNCNDFHHPSRDLNVININKLNNKKNKF